MQARVVVASVDLDEVSGRLWRAGAAGIEERPVGSDGARVELVAGAPADRADALAAVLAGAGTGTIAVVGDDAWLDAWRAHARPVRVGARLVVRPAWVAAEQGGPDDVEVVLDPCRTFGSGAHVTTRLVLAELEARIHGGERVLDVGCGSGVLAVAARRLGAKRVVAVDIDPEAVRVTHANAEANGVAGGLEASTAPVGTIGGRFDVVVANLLAPVLVELAPAMAARVTAGGALVLSGLLAEQAAGVLAAYPGLTLETTTREREWVALGLRR